MQKENRNNYLNYSQVELKMTVVFGAIFYMLFNGFKKNFKYYNQPKYRSKNLVTGYFIKLVFIILIIIGAMYLSYYLYN